MTTPQWAQFGTSTHSSNRYVSSSDIFGTTSSNWEAETQTGWEAPSTSNFGSQPVWSPLENSTTGVESHYDSNAFQYTTTWTDSDPNASFVAQPLTGNGAEVQWSISSTLDASTQVPSVITDTDISFSQTSARLRHSQPPLPNPAVRLRRVN